MFHFLRAGGSVDADRQDQHAVDCDFFSFFFIFFHLGK